MNSTIDVTLTGDFSNDRFGNSVSEAGDVNGDGFSDIILASRPIHSEDTGTRCTPSSVVTQVVSRSNKPVSGCFSDLS